MKSGALQAGVSSYGGANEMKFLYILDDQQNVSYNAQNLKFPIKDLLSKIEQTCYFLHICSHLLKKLSVENLIFCAVHLGENRYYSIGKIDVIGYQKLEMNSPSK